MAEALRAEGRWPVTLPREKSEEAGAGDSVDAKRASCEDVSPAAAANLDFLGTGVGWWPELARPAD